MRVYDSVIEFINFIGLGLTRLLRLLSDPDPNYQLANTLFAKLNTELELFNSQSKVKDSSSISSREKKLKKLDVIINELEQAIKKIDNCNAKIQLLIRLKSFKQKLVDPGARDITPDKIKKVIFTSAGGSAHQNACEDAILRSGYLEDEILVINLTTQGFMKTGDSLSGRVFGLIISIGHFILGVIGPENLGDLSYHQLDYGMWGVANWNSAQKAANNAELRRIISDQKLTDYFFGYELSNIIRNVISALPNLEQVESNQPVANQRIVEQVQEVNQRNLDKQPIHIIITSTDYIHASDPLNPISGSVHFNQALAQIESWYGVELRLPNSILVYDSNGHIINNPSEAQKLQQLYKIFPTLEEAVINGRCRVVLNEGAIRTPFKSSVTIKTRADKLKLKTEVKILSGGLVLDEQQDLKNIFGDEFDGELDLSSESKVHTIMLGSQVSETGALALVDARVQAFFQAQDTRENLLFVFCGSNTNLYSSLIHRSDSIRAESDGKFRIVPLGLQDSNTVAHVFGVSDSITYKPSGGMCLEIESTLRKLKLSQPDKAVCLYSYTELDYEKKSKPDWLRLRAELLQATDEDLSTELVAWECTDWQTLSHILKQDGLNAQMVMVNSLTAQYRITELEYKTEQQRSCALLLMQYLHNPTIENKELVQSTLAILDLSSIMQDLRARLKFCDLELADTPDVRNRFIILLQDLLQTSLISHPNAQEILNIILQIRQSQIVSAREKLFSSQDGVKIKCLLGIIDQAYQEFLTYNTEPVFGLDLFGIYTLRANTESDIEQLKLQISASVSLAIALEHVKAYLSRQELPSTPGSIVYFLARRLSPSFDNFADFVTVSRYEARKAVNAISEVDMRNALTFEAYKP